VRNGAYRGRWFEDVAGQSQRVKRSVVLGFVKEMRKSEAPRKLRSIIEATGAARAGELYGLEVADIDFARNTIHVRRSVWEGQKQSTKSRNANRAIDVQPSLVAMLKDYLNGRQEGLVTSSKNGKPLRNNNVLRRRLHPILQACPIREGRMHGFRHGSVSFLIENNTPVEVIKASIGHGSERMVRLYTHLRPQYRSRVLASIPSLVGNKIDVIDPLPLFCTWKK
jgi:integrase